MLTEPEKVSMVRLGLAVASAVPDSAAVSVAQLLVGVTVVVGCASMFS